jgi:hypothetical protein
MKGSCRFRVFDYCNISSLFFIPKVWASVQFLVTFLQFMQIHYNMKLNQATEFTLLIFMGKFLYPFTNLELEHFEFMYEMAEPSRNLV